MTLIGVSDLADSIAEADNRPVATIRIGVVTAVEVTGSRRVQCDIGGTTWLSRVQDASIQVGDRVSILQQGNLMLVIGRLSGQGADVPIGGMIPYSGATVPNSNWVFANGQALSRTTYALLFAACGTTYGVGDGSTTFNVPNMTDRVPVGSGGTYSRGQQFGAATVTLTTSQIPGHNHSFSGSLSGGSAASAGSHSHSVGNQSTRSDIGADGGSTVAADGGGSTGSGGSHSHSVSGTVSGTTGSTGSGGSHENMQPSLGVPYIIRVM